METKYFSPASAVQPNEEAVKLSTDQTRSLFVNDNYRSGTAVTVGTALAFPCDALNLSAASTLEVQMAEDPAAEPVTLTLPSGISKVGVAKVVSASGGPTITALYVRRPPAEV